ncbi:transglycosylase SLT domain-containing protein [Peijinzhouia sedimentorum]
MKNNLRALLQILPWVFLLAYIGFKEFGSPDTPVIYELQPQINVNEPAEESNSTEELSATKPATAAAFTNAQSWTLPNDVNFAGEVVDMGVWDIRERFDRELHINTYWHNNTIFMIKRANRWLPAIEPILAKYGVPDDFKYLAIIESDLMNKVSPAKAVGFWQLLEGTAKEYGLKVTRDVDERYDPIKATEAACRYLLKAYEKFGSWTMVAASYNRGMAGMQRAIEDQKEADYYRLLLNDETSRYLFRILACKEILSSPSKYGLIIQPEHLYQPHTYKVVTIDDDINDLISFARSQGIDYKTLKLYNPWLRNDKLSVRRGELYEIKIPL